MSLATIQEVANHRISGIAGIADPPRILVVDDTPLSRDLVARMLREEGFGAARAGNAEEALAILRSERIDLVLLDIRMPGEDGLTFCRFLKSDRELCGIPVIFLSAFDDVSDRIRGFEAGGVDFISKPFFGAEVLARIRTHLRLEQAREAAVRQMNVRLEELRDAQKSILVTPEDLPEASFAVCYRPLGEVGGDIYDVLRLGDGVYGYFAGDISGHGIEASFVTVAVKALLHQFAGPLFTPEDTMRRMNLVLRTTLREGQYLTAAYARFSREKRLLTIVVAGHPAPIFLPQGGDARTFGVSSDPLGLFESVIPESYDISVNPGDRFYLFSDGAIEDASLPGGGRSIGTERLCRACEFARDLPLPESVNAMAETVRPAGGAAADDLLILGMEVPE